MAVEVGFKRAYELLKPKVYRIESELEGEDEKSPFVTIDFERSDEIGYNKVSLGDVGEKAEIEVRKDPLRETEDIEITITTSTSTFKICLSNALVELLIKAVVAYAKEG